MKDVLVTEFSETRSDRCLPRWEEEESDEDAPEKRLSPEELEEIKQLFKKFDLSPGPLVGIELEFWAPCSRVARSWRQTLRSWRIAHWHTGALPGLMDELVIWSRGRYKNGWVGDEDVPTVLQSKLGHRVPPMTLGLKAVRTVTDYGAVEIFDFLKVFITFCDLEEEHMRTRFLRAHGREAAVGLADVQALMREDGEDFTQAVVAEVRGGYRNPTQRKR